VFVCNHLGALGPIAAGASLPIFVHPWIHADLLDPVRAADYLRRDFVEPQLRVPPPLSGWVSRRIAKVHVPLLRAVGGVPVHHTPEGLRETLSLSLDLLADGESILIFPEEPGLPLDARYNMRPFQKGFTRLGELYYERCGRALAFIPLAVHPLTRTLRVGEPIRYNRLHHPATERQRIKSMLERSIQRMLLEAAQDGYLRLPLPN
jgi:hypothetical protein